MFDPSCQKQVGTAVLMVLELGDGRKLLLKATCGRRSFVSGTGIGTMVACCRCEALSEINNAERQKDADMRYRELERVFVVASPGPLTNHLQPPQS